MKQLLTLILLWASSLYAIAQHEGRSIFVTTHLPAYLPLGPGRSDGCRIGMNDTKGSDATVLCNKPCRQTKRHRRDHCNCPLTGQRLENGKYYTLLNPCEKILLYKRIVNPNKWTTFEYFFSKGVDTPLLPLTRQNLENAFSDDIRFTEKLAVFRNNSQLRGFDRLYNMYILNWLYLNETVGRR